MKRGIKHKVNGEVVSAAIHWRLGTAIDHRGSMEPGREKMIVFLCGFRMFRGIAQNLGRPPYMTT
jgi:hypothetical protein